jgi:hypothetical protein
VLGNDSIENFVKLVSLSQKQSWAIAVAITLSTLAVTKG